MGAYLLNLIFGNPGPAGTATGLFNDYNSSDPVGAQSKAWYTIPAGWPAPGNIQTDHQVTQVANLAAWGASAAPIPDKPRVPGESTFSCGMNTNIYIRVAPDSSWTPLPNNLDGLIATFGRPNGNRHDGDSIASPFVLGEGTGNGQNTPCAYFGLVTPANQTIAPLSDGSWILYLSKTAQNAPGNGPSRCPNGKCTYSFIVAAGFWQGGNLYSYGHDPQIGVEG